MKHMSLPDAAPETQTTLAPRSLWLPEFLRPEPPAETKITDPAQIEQGFKYFQPRILFWTTAGYAFFYFVRKNIAVAMPAMEHQLGIGKPQLGLFLTLHGVLYGISKFANGMLADRCNGRILMVLGLSLSALMNVFFGMSHTAFAFGMFWMLNGWFQGVGFPPIARLLTHWYPPKILATKMSIWNTSHTIGYASILVICGFLVKYDWRLCFYVPAALAILMSVGLFFELRDTPESVGLPEAEGTNDPAIGAEACGDEPEAAMTDHDLKLFIREMVFKNPAIWIFSLANFFVYTIRYSVADWGPTMLSESKGVDVMKGSWMTAAFEVAGLFGILLSGWLTDRFFSGKTPRVCAIYMFMAGVSLFLFWKTPPGHAAMNTVLLMATGFFIYGPQALIGVAAANLATKRAAATAVGLTGIFGYASTTLSGWGLGLLVKNYGWNVAFECLVGVALIGVLVFVCIWNAKAHGYAEDPH
jgi:OPA family glycerol-3-phosphate transporter-like MFS transporter/OPA family sugar phosphate sensor protein UhpC-like MFS transporter